MKKIALLAIVAAGLLALAGTAQAKEIVGLKICGASGCKETTSHLVLGDPTASVSYAQPAPFYKVELRFGDGQTIIHRENAYWLPGSGLMRFSSEQGGWWMPSELPALRDAASGIDAFTPQLSRVKVGGKVATDPSSYLALMGKFPGALLPSGKLHPVRIVMRTSDPNPWVDRLAAVGYIAKRHLLIRSDGYFKIPKSLGRLVMHRASLSSKSTTSGAGGGNTALFAGLGAGGVAALAVLAVARRKRMH
jgi:hypothetical protein